MASSGRELLDLGIEPDRLSFFRRRVQGQDCHRHGRRQNGFAEVLIEVLQLHPRAIDHHALD